MCLRFLPEIVKAAAGTRSGTQSCRLWEECTSDGHEHKLVQCAGPERDIILLLHVTACGEQGCHCHDV